MKKHIPFTLGLILSLFILYLMLLNTVFCLIKHYIISWQLYVVPLAAFVISLLPVIISKAPKWLKVLLPAALAVCSLIYCGFFSLMGHTEYRVYEGTDGIAAYMERYEKTSEYTRFCPVDIEDFGSLQDINLYYYDFISIFSDRSRMIIASYEEAEYKKLKKKLQIKNPDYTAEVDGFSFAISKSEAFPKSISFSGFNDATNEIATIYYQNMDLDGISNFENFIRGWCGWDLIE